MTCLDYAMRAVLFLQDIIDTILLIVNITVTLNRSNYSITVKTLLWNGAPPVLIMTYMYVQNHFARYYSCTPMSKKLSLLVNMLPEKAGRSINILTWLQDYPCLS